jgi:hypothetical protein
MEVIAEKIGYSAQYLWLLKAEGIEKLGELL